MPNELDKSLEELGLALAVRPEAYEAVRKSAQTHEGVHMSSGVALRLIKIMDAATAATKAFTASPAILSLEKDAAASDEVLAELEALEEKASPAPWQFTVDEDNYENQIVAIDSLDGYTICANICRMDGLDMEAETNDAEFIAALRNAAPALLARVRTAEANLAAALNTLNAHNAPGGLPFLYERGEAAGKVSASGLEVAAVMRWVWPVMDSLMESVIDQWSDDDLLQAHCTDYVRDKAFSLLAVLAKANPSRWAAAPTTTSKEGAAQ